MVCLLFELSFFELELTVVICGYNSSLWKVKLLILYSGGICECNRHVYFNPTILIILLYVITVWYILNFIWDFIKAIFWKILFIMIIFAIIIGYFGFVLPLCFLLLFSIILFLCLFGPFINNLLFPVLSYFLLLISFFEHLIFSFYFCILFQLHLLLILYSLFF